MDEYGELLTEKAPLALLNIATRWRVETPVSATAKVGCCHCELRSQTQQRWAVTSDFGELSATSAPALYQALRGSYSLTRSR